MSIQKGRLSGAVDPLDQPPGSAEWVPARRLTWWPKRGAEGAALKISRDPRAGGADTPIPALQTCGGMPA